MKRNIELNMKKETLILGISVGIIVLLCVCVWKFDLLNPNRLYSDDEVIYKYEPDDEFSRKVMSAVNEDFWYRRSELDGTGVLIYAFEYESNDPASIARLECAVNDCSDLIDGKCKILVADSPIGATIPRLTISNYKEYDDSDYDRSGFCYLRVDYDEYEPVFLSLDIYIGMKGIKWAEIPDKLQEKADEAGIDWYEVWPDLEEVVVYETNK